MVFQDKEKGGKMIKNIVKRDGRVVSYDDGKIVRAIQKAMPPATPPKPGKQPSSPPPPAPSSKKNAPAKRRRWRIFRTRWKSR